jgi:PKHD-type hydroxylase
MLLLSNVLSAQDVDAAVEVLDSGEYDAARLAARILASLDDHPLFQLAVQPTRVSAVRFQRFSETGLTASTPNEADTDHQLRRDVSVILCLAREGYIEGGELTVDSGFGPTQVALTPGTAVLFPATSGYHVSSVTRGTFWLAQATVESRMRDAAQREIVYDIGYTIKLLEQSSQGTPEAATHLRMCLQSLLQMWG